MERPSEAGLVSHMDSDLLSEEGWLAEDGSGGGLCRSPRVLKPVQVAVPIS